MNSGNRLVPRAANKYLMDHRYDNLHLASTKRADFLYFSSWKNVKSSDNFPQKNIFSCQMEAVINNTRKPHVQ